MRMLTAALAMLVVLSAMSVSQKNKAEVKTDKQKASYGIGLNIGKNLKEQLPDVSDIDLDAFFRGLTDGLSGTQQAIGQEELANAFKKFQEDLMKRQSEKNKKEGDEFLAANAKKSGVVTLPSGLQYKVIKQGTGRKPTPSDTVECNYKGTLINGKEFDSSYKRGQPASFVLGQVIKGWIEGLQLMSVGSTYDFYIPSNLAYGERGAGGDIGPNATLIFEVELLGIK